MGTTGGDSEMEHAGHDHAVAQGEAPPSATATAAPTTDSDDAFLSGGTSRTHPRHSPSRNGARPAPGLTPGTVALVAPSKPARSRAKRLLDLGLAVAVLPLAGVVGFVIAVLVATTSRGSVLFFQERVGLGGRTFRMVKFRTMQPDAEQRLREDPELWSTYVDNDFKLPAESDPRLTRVGRLLRRCSLDELPQVLNVLTGDMSWVGPRPVTPDQLEDWGSDSGAYLSLRPGITGWWQINGRSDVQSMDRIAYDRDYVDSWNLWLDLRILVRTPFKVVHGKGAF